MKRLTIPTLRRHQEPDASLVFEGENDQCTVSIRVPGSIWADPRAQRLVPKLFPPVAEPSDDEAAA